jgi:protein involved in polysaccharide export with SLBB domain
MNNRLRMSISGGRFVRRVVVITLVCLWVSAGTLEGQEPATPASAAQGTAMPSTGAPTANPTPTSNGQSEPAEALKALPASPTKARGLSGAPSGKALELTDFQQLVVQSLGYSLPIYGASLFTNPPSTFAPVDRIPVTVNYVVGPGDELLIRAWGQIDFDIHARVDRSGSIFIPKVGKLNVAGLKFEQLHGFLTSQISRIYQNFDLNVTMGDLRSIDIFVVGQAQQPGRYTVSSLSTLANAIFASGGPSPSGSMRRIQLKRGSKVVTEFDLYDLLILGDKSHDVPLQPEDVLYFPPVGPQVAVGGQSTLRRCMS